MNHDELESYIYELIADEVRSILLAVSLIYVRRERIV